MPRKIETRLAEKNRGRRGPRGKRKRELAGGGDSFELDFLERKLRRGQKIFQEKNRGNEEKGEV